MKKLLCALFVCSFSACAVVGQSESDSTLPHCQILDEPRDPLYSVSLAFLPEERYENYGRSSTIELDADWELAYFHDVLWGEIDLNFRFRTTLLMDSAGLQLPNQVMELSLDTGWTLRTTGGTAFQLRLRPGMYSDVESLSSEVFYVPFSLALIQSFNDRISGIAGFDVRPGFERVFIPRVGLVWLPGDTFRVKAGVPESKLEWFAGRLWSVYAGFEWLNTTYDLDEEGALDRGEITLEDYRIYLGFSRVVSGSVRLTCDVGQAFERSVSFAREATGYLGDVGIENGMFIRVGMVGSF